MRDIAVLSRTIVIDRRQKPISILVLNNCPTFIEHQIKLLFWAFNWWVVVSKKTSKYSIVLVEAPTLVVTLVGYMSYIRKVSLVLNWPFGFLLITLYPNKCGTWNFGERWTLGHALLWFLVLI